MIDIVVALNLFALFFFIGFYIDSWLLFPTEGKLSAITFKKKDRIVDSAITIVSAIKKKQSTAIIKYKENKTDNYIHGAIEKSMQYYHRNIGKINILMVSFSYFGCTNIISAHCKF